MNSLDVEIIDKILKELLSSGQGVTDMIIYDIVKTSVKGSPLEGYEFTSTERIINTMREENLIKSSQIQPGGYIGFVTLYQIAEEGKRVFQEGGFSKYLGNSKKSGKKQKATEFLKSQNSIKVILIILGILLATLIYTQNYEIDRLRKENLRMKSKLKKTESTLEKLQAEEGSNSRVK